MPKQKSQSSSSGYHLTALLGDLGSLPFTLLSLLMIQGYLSGAGLQSTSVLGLYAPYVFIAYSAVILSFMSGTLWASWQTVENGSLAKLIVLMSNLLALSTWCALLLIYVAPIMTIFAVTLLMLGFISLLWAERLVNPVDKQYWRMRLSLTSLVTGLHLVVVTLMLMEF